MKKVPGRTQVFCLHDYYIMLIAQARATFPPELACLTLARASCGPQSVAWSEWEPGIEINVPNQI